MRFLILFFLSATLFSCATVVINNPTQMSTKPVRVELPFSYDAAWSKLNTFVYIEGYTVKSISKEKGTILFEMKRVEITHIEKNGELASPTALAVTEVRKKINNNINIYPVKGVMEWKIFLQKKADKTTGITIMLMPTGTLNSYNYNKFKLYKTIKNINLYSTGIFEKKMLNELKTAEYR